MSRPGMRVVIVPRADAAMRPVGPLPRAHGGSKILIGSIVIHYDVCRPDSFGNYLPESVIWLGLTS
jgi:hypothetical protein